MEENKTTEVVKEVKADSQDTTVKTEQKAAPTQEVSAKKTESENKPRPNNNQRGPRRNNKFGRKPFKRNTEFEERVVNISRVTNVVKGGRRFSFSALVVIGNKKGKVGYGHGKAKEVPEAIKKAIKDARRNMIYTPIVDSRTVPHISQAKFISSEVMIKPASKGRGIIASGAVRAVVELAGYRDIVTKSIGSSNKTNVVKATLKALSELRTVKRIAELRDKDVSYFE